MSNKAILYTYSIIYMAAEAFKNRTPFVVAVVEDGEERILTRIEGYNNETEITIGMEVELLRYDENGRPIYQFVS